MAEQSPDLMPYFYSIRYSQVVPKRAFSLNRLLTTEALEKQQANFASASPPFALRSLNYDADYSGGACFLAVFEESTGWYSGFTKSGRDQFVAQLNSSQAHLADFAIQWRGDNPSVPISTPQYIAIWESWGNQAPVKQSVVSGDNMDWDTFMAQMTIKSQGGERLVKIRAYPAAGTFHLVGIFEEGATATTLEKYTSVEWAALRGGLSGTGEYFDSLIDFQVIDVDGVRSYILLKDETLDYSDWNLGYWE